MKKIMHIKVFLLATVLLVLGSCTKDFDEMNVNPNAATVVPATNVFLRAIMSTTYTLFGERLDVYYAGSYAGHTAAIGLGDYEYRVDINNSMWRSMFISMTYFVDAMALAEAMLLRLLLKHIRRNRPLICGVTYLIQKHLDWVKKSFIPSMINKKMSMHPSWLS